MKKLIVIVLTLCIALSMTLPALAESYTYEAPVKSAKLARSTPEDKGIQSQYILDLLNDIEFTGTEVHAIMMAAGGDVIFEGFYAPYTPEDPHIMFSATKLFTNAAVGVAVTDGALSLDSYVVDVLADYLTEEPSENQKMMQLKHLITMTSGHDRMISGSELRPMKTSWLEHLLVEPVVHVPGEHYIYSSGNSVLASGMVQVATGMTCLDVLMKSGFGELGIENMTWDIGPDGINAGHGGVKITIEDILKVGQLYMNGGVWNGRQILSKEWCDYAIGYEKTLENQGDYAYHWTSQQDGLYYTATGSYGQTLLICPSLDMVIAVTAGTNNSVHQLLYKNVIAPIVADRLNQQQVAAALAKRADTLSLLGTPIYTASPVAETINGKTFTADENQYGITSVKLDVTDGYIDYTMTDARGTHTIRNGVGEWLRTQTSMTSSYTHHQYQYDIEPIVAYAEWKDDYTLEMTWRWPQLAFVDTVTVTFAQDGSAMSLDRSVNVNSGPLVCETVSLH
ncbi:MAG: serine hydrolase [Clostridia bacterium]|nr:serine hydrolase [Clostridia bacterium]